MIPTAEIDPYLGVLRNIGADHFVRDIEQLLEHARDPSTTVVSVLHEEEEEIE